jgi:poly-gamma-glutamate capsule biosynthesis protein CapA/YwtB (metallophosphatase superfamily)
MRENTKLLFCGDLVIAEKLESMDLLEADLIEMFKESDFKIVNLEAPVTNSTSKILKTGPHIIANKESTLQLLQSLQVDVLTLANNHILDYDEKGVIDTLEFCKDFHIQSVGAGIDLIEASKILYLDAKDGIIAVNGFNKKHTSDKRGSI